jgi:3D (Asp-Asp-Asp) domain-containing protein
VGSDFSKALALAGTGRLGDGRVLSYAGPCSCPSTPCYLVADADHPWGYGVKDIALAPFRSIAVNTSDIPIGTPLYVPAFDGLSMPGDKPWGGFVHDGCVRADDTRTSLATKQLDWFVAFGAYQQKLDADLKLVSVIVHEGGTRCL